MNQWGLSKNCTKKIIFPVFPFLNMFLGYNHMMILHFSTFNVLTKKVHPIGIFQSDFTSKRCYCWKSSFFFKKMNFWKPLKKLNHLKNEWSLQIIFILNDFFPEVKLKNENSCCLHFTLKLWGYVEEIIRDFYRFFYCRQVLKNLAENQGKYFTYFVLIPAVSFLLNNF